MLKPIPNFNPILTLFFGLALSACGGGSGDESSTNQSSNTNNSSATSQPIQITQSQLQNVDMLARVAFPAPTVKSENGFLTLTHTSDEIADNRHYQFFLNTDNNSDTGYGHEKGIPWANIGADYLVEDGLLFEKYQEGFFRDHWTWHVDIGDIEYTKSDSSITVKINQNLLLGLTPQFRMGFVIRDENWNVLSVWSASSQMAQYSIDVNSTIDTVPPVISLNGASSIEILRNTIFNDPGATATDNIDTDLTINTSSNLDTSINGTYTITYKVSDQAGNQSEYSRTVIVKSEISNNIVIDGSISDWINIDTLVESGKGSIKLNHDSENLYVLINGNDLGENTQIFLDVDNNSSTGFQFSGSVWSQGGADYMLENNDLNQSTSNDSSWAWDYAVAEISYARLDNIIEVAIPKHSLVNLEDSINVGFVNRDAGWNVVSVLPVGGMVQYSIDPTTPTNNQIPSPISPSGSTDETNPRFVWTSVPNAILYQLGYEDPNTESEWQSYTLTSEESSCTSAEGNCYYTPYESELTLGDRRRWWVRALVDGVWSEWSDGLDFVIEESVEEERAFIFTVKGLETTGRFGRILKDFVVKINPNYSYNYNVDCNSDGILEAQNINVSYICVYDDVAPNFIEHDISITGQFPSFYQEPSTEPYNVTGLSTKSSRMIINVKQWGKQAWKSMEGAFTYSSLETISATDNPNLSQVENMNGMFAWSSFPSDFESGNKLAGWDVSNVKTMKYMFNRTFPSGFGGGIRPNLSNWNVSNVTDMTALFLGNVSKFNQDISNWDVGNVISMEEMFLVATSFNQDISNWDVSNVKNMNGMFKSADAFNQDISNWDVRNVINMEDIFIGALSFNQDIGSWDISTFNSLPSFSSTSLSTENYDKILIGWGSQLVQEELTLNANEIKYSSNALDSRNKLINQYNWTINDGGLLQP